MTDHDSSCIDLLHRWQELDDMARAQTVALEQLQKARDSAWCNFLFVARKRTTEVAR